MKIAVCLYGQPRFLENASQSFCEEFFDLPGHEVDVFIHFWDNLGYTTYDDVREKNQKLQKNSLIEKCHQLYGKDKVKKIWIEDPENRLSKRASELCNLSKHLRWNALCKLKPEEQVLTTPVCAASRDNWMTHEMGQFFSIERSIKLKNAYEEEHNFKYDLVVRTRSDCVYPPKEVYNGNLDQYYNHKESYYSVLEKKFSSKGLVCDYIKFLYSLDNGGKDLFFAKENEVGQDTNLWLKLDSIIFQKGQLIDIKKAKEENKPLITENLISPNGIFNFPYKLWLSDFMMIADSETADRVWGNISNVQICQYYNDYIRFLCKKQMQTYVSAEGINGLSCLVNDARVFDQPSDRRAIKIIHENESKVKQVYIKKHKHPISSELMKVSIHGDSVVNGTPEQIKQRIVDFAKSGGYGQFPNLPLCRAFKNNV